MQRPNILILYTDQQRWDALGANGNDTIITPHLDQLAADGTNFDHFFVQNPVCMPSRASFLTGMYPSTLGITHMGVPLPEDIPVLPHYLRPYGYHTANIGKLHFLPHANRDHREPHPLYGFDHLELADEPGAYEDAYRAWVRQQAPDQMDFISPGLPPTTAVWQETMGIADGIVHRGDGGRFDFKGAIPFRADEHLTHTAFVAEQTIHFLQAQDERRPFLCVAGFYSPHSPWIVPQRYLDLYERDQLGLPAYPPEIDAGRPSDPDEQYSDAQLRSARHGYYAMITEVDHYIGRIRAALAQQNLADNTIIVFTSDHGEWLGDHLRFGKGYPGDDPVSRVPLIVYVPDALSGQTCSDLVEAVDVLPTLLDLAGIQQPPRVQGQSFAPVLRGTSYAARASALMEATGWKNLRTARYRYLLHADGREQLWDIEADPGEYHDISGEPAAASVLAEHRHLLLRRLLQQERPLARTWTY